MDFIIKEYPQYVGRYKDLIHLYPNYYAFDIVYFEPENYSHVKNDYHDLIQTIEKVSVIQIPPNTTQVMEHFFQNEKGLFIGHKYTKTQNQKKLKKYSLLMDENNEIFYFLGIDEKRKVLSSNYVFSLIAVNPEKFNFVLKNFKKIKTITCFNQDLSFDEQLGYYNEPFFIDSNNEFYSHQPFETRDQNELQNYFAILCRGSL